MSERKNIDRLFQEKFKDFEANPPEETWGNIEAKLEEKKKKRIIPFWWKFSGVAAVLLIGFLIGKAVYSPDMQTENQSTPKNNLNNTPSLGHSDSAVVEQGMPNHKKDNTIDSNPNISNENQKKKSGTNPPIIAVADRPSPGKTALKNKTIHKNHMDAVTNPTDKNTSLAQNGDKADNAASKSKIDSGNENQNNTTTNAITENKTINLDDLKGAPNSNPKIVTTEKKVNDTTKIASVTPNALEELLKEKESKEKQAAKENRWQITSNVAPVFLGSVTNGSPVDPKFENNSKEYNTSFSIGVGVSYAVNDKISIRTGINKMSVDYNTNDVAFFVNLDNTGLKNINASTTGQAISVENDAVETQNLLPFENTFAQKNEGYMNQKMGYYEVPIELSYAIVNKRFGVKVIGGISTFFLNENAISLVSENMNTDLGKANNLNDVHFSTNLGLGLKYTFLKSFEFHVEPTLKYQLNTFSDNSGNFKPYIFGLYSGISYNF
jgi:hypothetical protein